MIPQAGNTEIRAQILNHGQVTALWGYLAPALESVPEFCDYWTTEAVAQLVLDNQIQVWAFGEERVDLPRLVVFTQVVVYPKRRVLEVMWVVGKDVRRYEETASWMFDTFAEQTGVDLIRFKGPDVFMRLLRKQSDLTFDGVVCSRLVTRLRRQ